MLKSIVTVLLGLMVIVSFLIHILCYHLINEKNKKIKKLFSPNEVIGTWYHIYTSQEHQLHGLCNNKMTLAEFLSTIHLKEKEIETFENTCDKIYHKDR